MHEIRAAVVIPAFNEAKHIRATILSVPPDIDAIFVVDDASSDETARLARETNDVRIRVLSHENNRGVGAAIVTGYRAALEAGASVCVVMAGDNQMDGADLHDLILPVQRGEADYVKGNRLAHPRVMDMPWLRRLGSAALARLTSWASGNEVHDSQCGYTAISAHALQRLNLQSLWPRYGYPNDLLLSLASRGLTILERPVRPVYQGEASGLRFWHAFVILFVIVRRLWLVRLERKNEKRTPQPELAS